MDLELSITKRISTLLLYEITWSNFCSDEGKAKFVGVLLHDVIPTHTMNCTTLRNSNYAALAAYFAIESLAAAEIFKNCTPYFSPEILTTLQTALNPGT